MEDVTELVAELGSLLVQVSTGGLVGDERGSEEVGITEGKGGRLAVDGAETLGGVTLEHEEGVGKRRARSDVGGKVLPGLLHGLDVVRLEVQREAGVDKAILLAGSSVEADASPLGEVTVVSRVGRDSERTNVVERLADGGINSLDAFLDDPEENDGLARVSDRHDGRQGGDLRCWGRRQGC